MRSVAKRETGSRKKDTTTLNLLRNSNWHTIPTLLDVIEFINYKFFVNYQRMPNMSLRYSSFIIDDDCTAIIQYSFLLAHFWKGGDRKKWGGVNL